MLLMLKHLSARGSLFLFVRTHRQLEYYFHFKDGHGHAAANEGGMVGGRPSPDTASRHGANVIGIHTVARNRSQRRR
jgi:hypothetical protein